MKSRSEIHASWLRRQSPVVLGGGVPLLETGAPLTRLALVHSQSFPSGVVILRYDVLYATA